MLELLNTVNRLPFENKLNQNRIATEVKSLTC